MEYKRANIANLPEFLQRASLQDSGLLDYGYELLIALEGVYSSFLEHTREEHQRRAEAEKIKNQERQKYRGR